MFLHKNRPHTTCGHILQNRLAVLRSFQATECALALRIHLHQAGRTRRAATFCRTASQFCVVSIRHGCRIETTYSVGRFFKFLLSTMARPSPTFCSIMARTLSGSPKRVMKPWASLWLYSSPVVNEAMSSL